MRFVALVACLLAPGVSFAQGADGDFERRTSAHFVLQQDVAIDRSGGFHGSRRFELQVLDDLENAFARLEALLGLRPERRLTVWVYDADVFDREFAGLFRFPAAGFYGGVIRVRSAPRHTGELSRVLHHELVHAAFDGAAPSLVLPAWINEGTAEWFEARALGKRGLSPGERGALARLAAGGSLMSLDALSVPAFGHLAPHAAQVAYLQSYALIDFLVRRHGEGRLAQFLDSLLRSRSLDRSLRRVYRLDRARLEASFLEEIR